MEAFNKGNPSGIESSLEELLPIDFYKDNLDGKWTGKWIYLSMGSIVSVDVALMKRLTQLLAKTNHKYIVSKGCLHKMYQLPKNMWGEEYLPQVRFLDFCPKF